MGGTPLVCVPIWIDTPGHLEVPGVGCEFSPPHPRREFDSERHRMLAEERLDVSVLPRRRVQDLSHCDPAHVVESQIP